MGYDVEKDALNAKQITGSFLRHPMRTSISQPVMVSEYKIAHYRCPFCRKEVAPTTQATHMKANSERTQSRRQRYKNMRIDSSQKNTKCNKQNAWAENKS
jgi:histone acetyltransferase (RNA polymerase elongator complex component)